MKSILTKADVEKAKASLLSQGKRPTLAALHAALDNRGSMTTLVEIKAEIDAAKNTQADSPEALESLRNIWALARAEERKEQEGQLAELRECIAALSNENQRLEGTSAAAEKRAGDMSEAKSQAEAALHLPAHQCRPRPGSGDNGDAGIGERSHEGAARVGGGAERPRHPGGGIALRIDQRSTPCARIRTAIGAGSRPARRSRPGGRKTIKHQL
jgi:hypothetical protein